MTYGTMAPSLVNLGVQGGRVKKSRLKVDCGCWPSKREEANKKERIGATKPPRKRRGSKFANLKTFQGGKRGGKTREPRSGG